MWKDEIVEEVRRQREAYVSRFHHDLDAIYRDLKAKERKSSRKTVSFPPKKPIAPLSPKAKKNAEV